MFTLEQLATELGVEFSGDGQRKLKAMATLSGAGPSDLTFLANSKYLSQLGNTHAGAVILHPDHVNACPADCLVSEQPYLVYARASQLFAASRPGAAGIHPSAVVADGAEVDAAATIEANAVVEEGARIAAGAIIGAGSYVGCDSTVGARTRVHPNVVLYHGVTVGDDCVIHSQAVIGADGFGFAPGPEGWEKIEQLGGVQIGNRVEIGASTTVDRGALDDTIIEDGVILDNLVQVAHNCRIGKNTAIAGCTGLAGSTIIGANCTLAGGVGVLGHLEICDNAHVTAMSMVTKSITVPGSYSSGTPMSPTREWKRAAVRFSQLESITQRLARLEKNTKTD
jgi:UDP-3-O-[3-hydroxymyristoyl] glucosamine N-acyltransferase